MKAITPPEGTFVATASVERSTGTVVFAAFFHRRGRGVDLDDRPR